jgi:hypothetical protein
MLQRQISHLNGRKLDRHIYTYISYIVADTVLGNDRELSKYTTAVSTWRLRKQACFHGNWTQQQMNGVFYVIRSEML